jgi:MYXO-CTERM domain-containing protein
VTKRGLLAFGFLLVPATASAHIALDAPQVRDGAMKTAPCGGVSTPGARATTFRPGETITVSWHETVAHPGFFRIAFSADGRTFPADPLDPPEAVAFPVLAIIPKEDSQTAYSASITLPDMECSACSIQVIQYMREHTPPPYYYQCADIVLSNSAPATGGAGGGGSAGASGTAPASFAEPAEEEEGCGCRVTGRGRSRALGLLGAAVAAFLVHRRRKNCVS